MLAPGQAGTLPLIKDWFTQIAQEFPSPFINIGADETWDLGTGRTHDAVAQQGYGPVYVAFLKQIHDELAPLNRGCCSGVTLETPTRAPSPECPRT